MGKYTSARTLRLPWPVTIHERKSLRVLLHPNLLTFCQREGYCGLCPECADETEPQDAECGILTIDWTTRTFTVEGAGGHAGDVMRPHQVLKELRRKPKAGVRKVPFIVWQENADGYAQLCLHDRKSFEEAVSGIDASLEPVHLKNWQLCRRLMTVLRRRGFQVEYWGTARDHDGDQDYRIGTDAPKTDLDFLCEAVRHAISAQQLDKQYAAWLKRPGQIKSIQSTASEPGKSATRKPCPAPTSS